jgi:hypothetical protein
VMTTQRASVFDQAPDIDISGFEPRKIAKPAARPDEVKAISETANFVSREPTASTPQATPRPARLHERSECRDTQNPPRAPVARALARAEEPYDASAENRMTREAQREPIVREPRRHRTGRNIQLNIKARAETIARFYAIADFNGWVLGETFERAIAALERTSAN